MGAGIGEGGVVYGYRGMEVLKTGALPSQTKATITYCLAQRGTPTLHEARDEVAAGAEVRRWQRIRFAYPR